MLYISTKQNDNLPTEAYGVFPILHKRQLLAGMLAFTWGFWKGVIV